MAGKTIAAMTDEIREVNVAKGHRPAGGGPGSNTFGDYIALLHSEVSEALEAYRDHRMADATEIYECPVEGCFGVKDCAAGHEGYLKPEGVGSEFADVLIRLLDMGDVFDIKAFDMDMELGDVADILPSMLSAHRGTSFGDHMAWLHYEISQLWMTALPGKTLPIILRTLVTTARTVGVDLTAEYERKLAYNRTRAFQHGGRTLTARDPQGSGA